MGKDEITQTERGISKILVDISLDLDDIPLTARRREGFDFQISDLKDLIEELIKDARNNAK